MFGTQQLYKELLACIEIVENQSYYEPTNAACHPLLSRCDIVAPFVHKLVRDSLCWNALLLGALIALSCVLHVWIQSYYPPISCAFVSLMTVNINGRSNSPIFFRYYSISNSMPWDFGKLVVCIISTKSFIFILHCVMFIAYTQKTT